MSIIDTLEKNLESYKYKKIKSDNQCHQQVSENDKYLNDFEKLCVEIICPTMETIGNKLNAHGHKYEIIRKKGNGLLHTDNSDSYIRMNVYLNMYPPYMYTGCSTPFISFSTRIDKKKIDIHTCAKKNRNKTSHPIYLCGSDICKCSCKLVRINRFSVQKAIVHFLDEILLS